MKNLSELRIYSDFLKSMSDFTQSQQIELICFGRETCLENWEISNISLFSRNSGGCGIGHGGLGYYNQYVLVGYGFGDSYSGGRGCPSKIIAQGLGFSYLCFGVRFLRILFGSGFGQDKYGEQNFSSLMDSYIGAYLRGWNYYSFVAEQSFGDGRMGRYSLESWVF